MYSTFDSWHVRSRTSASTLCDWKGPATSPQTGSFAVSQAFSKSRNWKIPFSGQILLMKPRVWSRFFGVGMGLHPVIKKTALDMLQTVLTTGYALRSRSDMTGDKTTCCASLIAPNSVRANALG